MTRKSLSAALENIAPRHIEECAAFRANHYRTPIILKWGLVACICLLVCSLTVFALGSGLGFIVIWNTGTGQAPNDSKGDAPPSAGYEAEVLTERIPRSALGSVLELEAIIKSQHESQDNYSSASPGTVLKSFTSIDEAYGYIGLTSLRRPELPRNEEAVTLTAYGNSDGVLQSLQLECTYLIDGVRIQHFSTFYTDSYIGTVTIGAETTENIAYTEEKYTTSEGLSCTIVNASPLSSGYIVTDGYIVLGGIIYRLHLAYTEPQTESADALLHAWANSFKAK